MEFAALICLGVGTKCQFSQKSILENYSEVQTPRKQSPLTAPFQRRDLRVANDVDMQIQTILLCFSFSFSAAFYFHAGEREEKCIIEDIPSDTLITGG